MEKKDNRKHTNYAFTREQKRFIAKKKMKEAGIKQFCKHSYTTNMFHGKPIGSTRIGSKFSSEWRNFAEEGV